MKKIIGLAIAGVMVLAMVAGGTMAWFSDTEDSASNAIAAGTLDLTWNGTDDDHSYVISILAADGYPGNSNSAFKHIKNVGSFTGELDIAFADLVNTESAGSTEYEADGGDGEHDGAQERVEVAHEVDVQADRGEEQGGEDEADELLEGGPGLRPQVARVA